MKKIARMLAISMIFGLPIVLGAAGCSNLRFPGVYRIPVQQGNIIDQKKVDQLRLGMTKRQAQFVMGSPLSSDVFHEDRWDYIYQLRRGEETLRDKRFTLFFENDRLTRFDGDYKPGGAAADQEDYIEDAEETQTDPESEI